MHPLARCTRLFLVFFGVLAASWSVCVPTGGAQSEVVAGDLFSVGGAVRATAVDGNRLLVAKGQRLIIYDLSGTDPILGDEPIELTQTPVGDMINSMAVAGDHAYLGLKGGEIVVVDISDEFEPRVVGRQVVRVNTDEDKEVEGLAILGSHLYCNLGKDGLLVVDISDPTNPQPGANLSGAQEWINGIAVANGRLYTLERLRDTSPTRIGVRVYSTTNPAAPSVEGFVEIDRNVGGLSLVVEGTRAFVFGQFWFNGIAIVDLSTPTSPQLLGTFSDGGEATPVMSVAAVGDRLYAQRSPFASGVPSQGLMTIDLSNPAAPSKIGEVDVVGSQSIFTGSLPIVNDRLVTTFGTGDIAMQMFDIADPDSPQSIRTFGEPTTYYAQELIGSSLYRSTQESIERWNVEDPHTPVLLDTWSGEEFSDVLAIAGTEDRLLFSRRGSGAIDGTITVVDLDGTTPTIRGSYTAVDANHKAILKGEYLYVISVDGDPWNEETGPWGLDVVSLANPDAPSRVARIEGTFRDIVADDERDLLYLLADDIAPPHDAHTGLVAFDISNPASPSIASSASTAGTRGRMDIEGDRIVAVTNTGSVFGGDDSWSLEVFDITNPQSIARTGNYSSAGGTMELASDVTASPSGIVTVGLMGAGYRFFELDAISGAGDDKSRRTAEDPKPSGSYASTGVSSFENYYVEESGTDYVVGKDYTWATVFSYPDNRNNYHRNDGGSGFLCYVRKEEKAENVILLTSVWPVKAAKAGCKVTPPGRSVYPRASFATVTARAVSGWNFGMWIGAASGSAVRERIAMNTHQAVAGLFRSGRSKPVISIDLGSEPEQLRFPFDTPEARTIKIGTVTLTPDLVTDWEATSITLRGVDDYSFVKRVILKVRGRELVFVPKEGSFDPLASMSFALNDKIPAGGTLPIEVFYEVQFENQVEDSRWMPCPIGLIDYGVGLTSADVQVEPDDPVAFPEYSKFPQPTVPLETSSQRFACVQDTGRSEAYGSIQSGISSVEEKTTVVVYPGRYEESLRFEEFYDNEVTITSLHGPDRTEIVSSRSPVIFVEGSKCTISGFRIIGNGGKGIEVEGLNLVVEGNVLEKVTTGIDVNSAYTTIRNNTILVDPPTKRGLSFGVDLGFHTHVVESNRIVGPGRELFGSGVHMTVGLNLRVEGNRISGFFTGISLNGVDNVAILRNHVRENRQGVDIYSSKRVQIVRNRLSRNDVHINLSNSDVRTFGNTATGSNVGSTIGEESGKGRATASVEAGIYVEGGQLVMKGEEILGDSATGMIVENEADATIRMSSIVDNLLHGILNNDPSSTVDARRNWWGDPSGPSGDGPGSGDAVSSSVDYADWLATPFDVVVSAANDTLWVRPGDADSLAIYFRNGVNRDGQVTIEAGDDRGWVEGAGAIDLEPADSLGGEHLYAYTIPHDIGEREISLFRFTATSTENGAQTDTDSLVIATYRPILTTLLIGPDTLRVLPGDTVDFTATGFDQHGRSVEIGEVVWNTSGGGLLDENGAFIIGGSLGTFVVTGRESASGVEGMTVVVVTDDLSDVESDDPVAGDPRLDLSLQVAPNPVRDRAMVRFPSDILGVPELLSFRDEQ